MARAATRDLLPAGVWPVALSREQAAYRAGISPTLFDRAVKDGKLPKPFRIYKRVLWHIAKLDAALAKAAGLARANAGDDPCSRLAL